MTTWSRAPRRALGQARGHAGATSPVRQPCLVNRVICKATEVRIKEKHKLDLREKLSSAQSLGRAGLCTSGLRHHGKRVPHLPLTPPKSALTILQDIQKLSKHDCGIKNAPSKCAVLLEVNPKTSNSKQQNCSTQRFVITPFTRELQPERSRSYRRLTQPGGYTACPQRKQQGGSKNEFTTQQESSGCRWW